MPSSSVSTSQLSTSSACSCPTSCSKQPASWTRPIGGPRIMSQILKPEFSRHESHSLFLELGDHLIHNVRPEGVER
jgi:hypothetical protein